MSGPACAQSGLTPSPPLCVGGSDCLPGHACIVGATSSGLGLLPHRCCQLAGGRWSNVTRSRAVPKCLRAEMLGPIRRRAARAVRKQSFPKGSGFRQFCLRFRILLFRSCSDGLWCRNFRGKAERARGRGPWWPPAGVLR